MYFILLGAPGAGKGTQAENLGERLGLVHLSSGDLFRENMAKGTPLGLKAKEYVDKGLLVPDDLTVTMVLGARPDGLEGKVHVLLDGFPRTIPQAEALARAIGQSKTTLGAVLHIKVPPKELLKRLSGRLTCRKCGDQYHQVFVPPKAAGKCDECGGELYQRTDDTEETARKRLEVYQAQTAPLIDYYEKAGLLVNVNGNRPVEAVTGTLTKAIVRRLPK